MIANIITGVIVAILFTLAIRHALKTHHRNGDCGCGCGCDCEKNCRGKCQERNSMN